jgi:hypothetical protein
MAAIFQIRRGTADVSSSIVDGELYLNKTKNSLQVSNGDGNPITLAKLNETNSGSLILQGNITASNAYFTGDVAISGNLFLGNNTSDNISALGVFTTNLNAGTTNTYNIGSTSSVWANIYANSISASFLTGSLYGMGDPTSFSTSVDLRLDRMEASASLYDNAMSGSNRLYVSPSGSDSNDGSDPSVPFRTIKAAVASLGSAIPGNIKRYTIFVGSGNYTEQNPIAVPPGVAIVGDTLRTVRLTAANPTKDFFHTHDANYFYGLRFLDLQYPAFAFSFPSSTAKATISGNSISSISLVHSLSGYTDGNNQDLGIIIEGPDASGSIATATANVSSGIITQINVVSGGNNYTSTEKPHISIPAPNAQRPIITTSPYVQNCSAITGPFNTSGIKVLQALPYDEATYNIDEQGAGGGIRIDGNLVSTSSPLESFVADAFTQVNQGGPGHLVINKGYAQFVSCFTTFCTYGFKVANGGFANISNSVIDFGKYGLVSKTYFPQTYNTGSSLETKTSTVSGFVIDENGAGYTGSVAGVTITGGGASVQATAQASVNANGSIDEIVLLTAGSGYTTQPSVTIATPTGPGAIQATTISNKALISGVSEILMALESGSRGVDISSNMILSGVNYLVTDVQQVSGQPSRRKITTYPAPPSITTNDQIKFHQLSNISTGGLVMEYVGSGVTYNALPKYGGVPIRTREVNEFAPGRVFYTTVDNIGNLKIGDFFAVNQLTGEVTIDANSFNLSGLNAIGPFKRNGVAAGVVLQEVSNNTTLLNSQGLYGEDTVPTQYAVKTYIDVRDGRLNNLETTSASIENRLSTLGQVTSSILNWTASAKVELSNLESKSASVDISVSKLNSYTSSLNQAIQLTGSTVSFLGDIVVYGTQSIIHSTNLEIGDNLIYLATGSSANTDFGVIGHYNDGTYRHGGIFRSGTDGAWRVFKGLTSEVEGFVDIAAATFQYADFYANAISASSLNGIGNVTSYSQSTALHLNNLESTSASVNISISALNVFTASQSTASLVTSITNINSYTASVSSSIKELNQHSASLNTWSGSINNFSGNVNIRFDNLQTYTTSVDNRFITLGNYTASVNQTTSSLNSFTQSTNIRLGLLETSTGSLNSFSASVTASLVSLYQTTSSLNSFSASVTASLVSLYQTTSSLNSFSASVTASFTRMTASINDHENRVTYIEGTLGIVGGNPLVPLNTFSASINTFTSSANTRFSNIEAATSSYETKGRGIVSGSSQLGNYVATIAGTSNQVLVAGSGVNNAAITLTTPQDIASTSNVQFNSLGIGMVASATAGRIDASGDVVAYSTSDERLKENIQPIQNALSKVETISGNEYNWKEEFENVHGFKGNDVGVIAQEIQKILPQAVIERENGYLGVNYEKIIPLLIQSIKELSAKIKELENK